MDAAHWVMRTSFVIQSVLYRFMFHSCTQDFFVALTMTHHFNATRAIVPCARSQTQRSTPLLLLFWSRQRDSVEVFSFSRWNLRLHRVSLSDILIPHVVSSRGAHLIVFTCVTSGGGTGGLWRAMVVHVPCGVDEQLVSWDTGQKEKILKRFGFCRFFYTTLSVSVSRVAAVASHVGSTESSQLGCSPSS